MAQGAEHRNIFFVVLGVIVYNHKLIAESKKLSLPDLYFRKLSLHLHWENKF